MAGSKDLTTLQRELASRLITLAEDALAQGEIAEAERLYREVLHFLRLILDEEHAEIVKTLYKLAYILEFQEKFAESLELIAQARTIMRNLQNQISLEAFFVPFVPERSS